MLVMALLVLLAFSSSATVFRLWQANASIETIYNDRVVCLGQLKAVSDGYAVSIATAAQKARDGAMTPADAIEVVTTAQARIDEVWRNYTGTYLTDHEKDLVAQAKPRMLSANDAVDRLLGLLRDRDSAGLQAFVSKEMYPALEPLSSVLGELVQLQMDVAQQEYVRAHHTYESARWKNAIITPLVLCLAAFACWKLIRSITGPLATAVKIAETVAVGDLTCRIEITVNDEIGQLLAALKRMNMSLLDIVVEVRASSEAIGAATKEIAAGNVDLSSRTEEQAASLEQTAASMGQLAGTVQQNAENARHARGLAANAAEIAARGNQVVAQVMRTMGEINESSSTISDISATIEGIAFQTNILALNAAVESARAGEHGRGFAVVASEVRALAHRSSAAAKEIKVLIETSAARVSAGTQLVDRAGATMHEMIAAVSRVAEIMGEISAASDEQSRGINQVALAITQMDDVTQRNAALVEEAAAAAQSLDDQAARLKAVVMTFKLEDDRAAAA